VISILEFSVSSSPRTVSVRRARFEQNQDCSYHWQGHHQQSYHNVWPCDVREQDASVLYDCGATKGSKHQCPQIAGYPSHEKKGNGLNCQGILTLKSTYHAANKIRFSSKKKKRKKEKQYHFQELLI
jgi:hypothetical protein